MSRQVVAEDIEPFLRWAGGKRQLLPSLLEELPSSVSKRLYVEPFLGAGSLFFALAPKRSILADANASLIATYSAIKRSPEAVRQNLVWLCEQHSSEHYYATRTSFNKTVESSPQQAARFIYLNKACFNGIYRVNKRGEFNVPKGSKDNLSALSCEKFVQLSAALGTAELCALDYKHTLAGAKASWFVYLDPPYPALNETAYFAHYTPDRFGDADQKALAHECLRLHNLGAKFLLSNADLPVVRELYSSFSIKALPVRRYVSCKGQKLHVSELLIKNYQ